MPTIESRGTTSQKKREEVLNTRFELMKNLPIDPDSINDEALIKVGLAPEDFMQYTQQARRRYKMAVAPDFLALIAESELTERPYAGEKF
jgi:hypothetical protein